MNDRSKLDNLEETISQLTQDLSSAKEEYNRSQDKVFELEQKLEFQ